MRRIACLSIAAFALSAAAPAFAWGTPDGVFVQGGAWTRVHSATVGATWDWGWQRPFGPGMVTGYTEVALGRWQTHGSTDDRGYTQFGVTPVFRLYPGGAAAGWFAELAIGANFISPIYHNNKRQFSTTFNFGDQLAVGRRFGTQGKHELALRFQHFSNGGYKHPNPGENFVQARYAYRF
jgi:hypothetical protein